MACGLGTPPNDLILASTTQLTLHVTSVDELGLSVRLTNGLKACGMDTIARLIAKSEDELRSYRSIGRFCVGEIREKLVEQGFLSRELADSRYPTGLVLSRDRANWN